MIYKKLNLSNEFDGRGKFSQTEGYSEPELLAD